MKSADIEKLMDLVKRGLCGNVELDYGDVVVTIKRKPTVEEENK